MTPIDDPSTVAPMPTASEIRAPWTIRLQTSRPNELVPIQCTALGCGQPVRGIDAERVEAADQVGRDRHPDEHHHDDKADRAEQIALRQKQQAAPAMRRMGAGPS